MRDANKRRNLIESDNSRNKNKYYGSGYCAEPSRKSIDEFCTSEEEKECSIKQNWKKGCRSCMIIVKHVIVIELGCSALPMRVSRTLNTDKLSRAAGIICENMSSRANTR